MPRVSFGDGASPHVSPRGRNTAASAFAAALADDDGIDVITPPTSSIPNEDTWREQSTSDSDSEYEVEAYEGPPGPASSRPSLRDETLKETRARKPDAFDRVAGGVGTVARGLWSATLIGPLVARNVFLLDPEDDASSSDSDDADEDEPDGLHGEIHRARLRPRDASRDDVRASTRAAEAAAADAMRSVFGVAARAARAVSPFASGSAPRGRKTLRPSLSAGDRQGVSFDGNPRESHSLASEKTFAPRRLLRSAGDDKIKAVSSTLAGLREELRLELEEETRAKLAEEERAARSAARVAQRAWAASKHTVSGAAKGAAQLGRDLLTRKEARAPERGAGSITVRVRHLHSLLGTYLAVHVTRGEDLLPMDVGNVSDPYVNLWLENEAGEKVNDLGCRRSTAYRVRTLNPEWNEVVFMGSARVSIETCVLKLRVMDFDVIGADDDMGTAEIPLRAFVRGAALDRSASGLAFSPKKATSESDSKPPSDAGDVSSSSADVHDETLFHPKSATKGDSAKGDSGKGEGERAPETREMDGKSTPLKYNLRKPRSRSRSFDARDRGRAKCRDPAAALRDFLAAGGGRSVNDAFETHTFLDLNDEVESSDDESVLTTKTKRAAKKVPTRPTRQIGTYRWIARGWMHCELRLMPPDHAATVRHEAMAMLSYATQVLDPRNVVRSIGNSGAGNWLSSKMDAAVQSGKRKAMVVFDDAVDRSRLMLVRKAVEDRDMPKLLQKYVGAAVNLYMSDAQRELMDLVGQQLGVHTKGDGGRRRRRGRAARGVRAPKNSFLGSLKRFARSFRNWVLYVEVPYDKTIFGKMRVPAWWLFLACKLYSGWGVQSLLFVFRLLLIDRTDEWQLFLFIVQFKGIQFFSGIASILNGVLLYVGCAGVVDKGEPHTCNTRGPGVNGESACSTLSFAPCVSLVTFSALSRILLSWYAFYLIHKSFAFGKQIVGEHRIVGAKIEVHEIVPGNPEGLAWTVFGKPAAFLRECFRRASPAARAARRRLKKDPLLRFRRVAQTVIDANRRARGERDGFVTGASSVDAALFDGRFRIQRRRAKIVAYDDATSRHAIVFKDDFEKKRQTVDLDALIFSVVRLKHMNPRRLQGVLNTYDVVVFFLAAIITVRFAFAVDYEGGEEWKLFALIFWTQSFYSLFAFPFILTVIPGVQKLICTARQTGYDRHGNLCAFVKRTAFESDRALEPEPRSKYVPACYPTFSSPRKRGERRG
jgi:hypothetical protein